jgi:hypothetical protein
MINPSLSSFTIKRRDMNDVTHSIMTCHHNDDSKKEKEKEIDSIHIYDLLFDLIFMKIKRPSICFLFTL